MVDENESPIDASLVQWIRLNDGFIHNHIEAGFVSQGWRGIIATQDIDPDECIVSIPRKILICKQSADQDQPLVDVINKLNTTTLTDTQLVAIHLIHQLYLGEHSFWHIYIKSIPPYYTTAICFTPDDVDQLQLPYAMQTVSTALHKATESYNQALPVLTALNMNNHCTCFSTWMWALSTLSSRTMYMPTDSAGALVPFGDLHNFHPHPPPYTPHIDDDGGDDGGGEDGRVVVVVSDQNNTNNNDTSLHSLCGDGALHTTNTTDEEEDTYKIFTRRRYNRGTEIYLNYGRHTNLELLEHYGFVLQDNPHDVAVLPIELFSESVQRQLNEWDAQPLIHNNGNPSFELLRALRLTLLSKEERKSKASAMVLNDKRANERNERAALDCLRSVCEKTLSSLPTTVEEDKRLELDGLSECAKVAIEWRITYKETLLRAIELCIKATCR